MDPELQRLTLVGASGLLYVHMYEYIALHLYFKLIVAKYYHESDFVFHAFSEPVLMN